MSTTSRSVSTSIPNNSNPTSEAMLAAIAARAAAEGVFGSVRVEDSVVRCDALASAEPAEYRVFAEGGKLWVALVTSDRWLSQSIEQDLVHTGDKIDELIEEELVDLEWKKEWGSTRFAYEHFRDDRKQYTFRSPVPVGTGPDAAERAAIALLAYERAFRPLGDMEADEDE